MLKDEFEIPAGTFVGIVGRAQEERLMKLLPRLYEPEEGRILIDFTTSERSSFIPCVVRSVSSPDPPVRGTVSENIALTNAEASSEEIVGRAPGQCP